MDDNRPAIWFIAFVVASAVVLIAVTCKAMEAMQGL